MGVPTNLYSTYDAIGQREALAEVILNIDPWDTPGMSSMGSGKASAVYEEWQTDTLESVDTDNSVLEGDEVTPAASTPTTRVGNRCQISRKSCVVSGTLEVVSKAGRRSEMAYQMVKKGKALRRDMEYTLLSKQDYATGDESTNKRKLRGLEACIESNTSHAGDGSTSSGTVTDGTQRAFTKTILDTVLQSCYSAGAMPKILMVGPYNRTVVSTFTGVTTNYKEVMGLNPAVLVGAIDVYVYNFGVVRVVPNRIQRDRTAFVMDPKELKVLYLRKFHTKTLGVTGDNTKKFIIVEYTLNYGNEKAQGKCADLTTS